MDVEGHEWAVLRALARARRAQLPLQIYAEFHLDRDVAPHGAGLRLGSLVLMLLFSCFFVLMLMLMLAAVAVAVAKLSDCDCYRAIGLSSNTMHTHSRTAEGRGRLHGQQAAPLLRGAVRAGGVHDAAPPHHAAGACVCLSSSLYFSSLISSSLLVPFMTPLPLSSPPLFADKEHRRVAGPAGVLAQGWLTLSGLGELSG